MAISRSLMNRQLRADGGIMQVAPREKFGLGSSIKKFVRKIIPNEVSEIAVKAAPFVAPFNPAVAAAMSGLGTFDQTGSIGDSLKGGALTYGLGQGARYLGGAGFQGNPFASGGAFTPSGFTQGFSSPLGNQTGFKLGKPVQEIKPISGGEYGQFTEPTFGAGDAIGGEGLTGGGEIISSSTATTPGSAMDSFQSIVSFDTSPGQKTDAALDLLKRGSKALFTKPGPDGTPVLDKAAVLGAVTAAASYAEALALAEDTGVEITEEEYDEAKKAEKKEEYASYLQNFFGGKKDGGRIGFNDGSDPGDIVLASDSDSELIKAGKFSRVVRVLMDEGFDFAEAVKEAMRQGYNQGGRIGFESGANEMIKTQLLEKIMPDTSTEDMIMIMTEDGPKMIKRSDFEAMPGMFRDTTTSAYGDAGRGRPVPEFANGGRIGFKGGYSPGIVSAALEEYNSVYGTDSSGEEILVKDLYSGGFEEFLEIYTGDAYEKRANGGRIGFKKGSPEETSEIGIMAIDVEAGDDDDMEDMDMAAGINFSRQEKSYLFKRLGGSGGSDRSYTMPNLYRILSNPGRYPEDAAILKEIAIMGLGGGRKDGGRIGYKKGANRVSELLILRDNLLANGEDVSDIEAEIFQLTGKTFKSVGGISDIPTGKIRKNNAGVVERDYRDEGGFVPVGIKERADDVPAMLSKNEFVMTADAVRGIGNGSVEEGSKKLYNTMKKAEQVGKA